MKKIGRAVLAAILVCMLAGCGSKASRAMDSMILAIGQVDASCGPVVEYVREQYEQLAPEDQEKLENYHMLLSAEAAYVDVLVEAIGDVTVDSSAAIEKAEKALAGLNADARQLVLGLDRLEAAKAECDRLIWVEKLSGTWVNEVLGTRDTPVGRGLVHSYGLDETASNPGDITRCTFELREDGKVLRGAETVGSWLLAEDRSLVTLTTADQTMELRLIEEGGYIKLVGSVFGDPAFGYVRQEEYAAAFAEKFTAVALDRENVYDYLAEPVKIGTLEAADGKTHSGYLYASKAYDKGLVYLGASCVIPVTYRHSGRDYSLWLEFPMLSTTHLKLKEIYINTDSPISGEIFYVKAEYVAENSINKEGYRVITLTNGVELLFDGYDDTLDTFWGRIDASYEEYIY